MKFLNLFVVFVLLNSGVVAQTSGHFKVRPDQFIQVGYNPGFDKSLSFGAETVAPNNGKYAIEYWSAMNGLNFYKPWPTANSANYILFLRDDTNVGIGTNGSSAFKLDINGKARATSWVTYSDRRLKEKISPLSSSLSKVLELRAVSYVYKPSLRENDYSSLELSEVKRKTIDSEENIEDENQSRKIGFIAQDVQKLWPEVVSEDENGTLGVDYTALVPVLVKALQEQQSQIDQLKKEIENLKG